MADPCTSFWTRVYQMQIDNPCLSRQDAINRVRNAAPELHQQMLSETSSRDRALRSLPQHQQQQLRSYTFDGSSGTSAAQRATARAAEARELVAGASETVQ